MMEGRWEYDGGMMGKRGSFPGQAGTQANLGSLYVPNCLFGPLGVDPVDDR